MCGIVGFSGHPNTELLKSMCRLLTHRGPDDEGYFEDSSMSLGMRRLAIIDLAGGHQPISNECENIWTVFNGEIYNHESLHRELTSCGHIFKTHSDTETIVHAYEEYGIEFLGKLRGMFAIALWDQEEKSLILARDRIGEKPLYYAESHGEIIFASESKSILRYLNSYSVDFSSVHSFLSYGFVPEDRTLFNEIKKLRPGWYLKRAKGVTTLAPYWSLENIAPSSLTLEEAEEQLHETLLETVDLCLKSDVEVGAFLSGGLDSSLLTALIRRNGPNVKTFSVGYSGLAKGFNELSYAKQVSEHVGTEHHELILDADSSIDILPKLIWHYDEPHGEPSSALVHKLAEYTSQHVKVAIAGNGADELFLGYPRHKGPKYLRQYKKIPRIVRRGLVEPMIRVMPESTKGSRFAKRAKRFVNGIDESVIDSYINWTVLFSDDEVQDLMSESHRLVIDAKEFGSYFRRILSADGDRDFERSTATLDMVGYLPEYQLCYMDRMSMANSLEVRAPFCDYRLIEVVHSFPSSYRLRGGESKYLLKKIAEDYLPKDIIYRKKVGFDSPIGQWFKTDLSALTARFLSSKQISQSGLLNPTAVQSLLAIHNSGKRDLSLHLWSIMALETWYRMYFEHPISELSSCTLADIRGAA